MAHRGTGGLCNDGPPWTRDVVWADEVRILFSEFAKKTIAPAMLFKVLETPREELKHAPRPDGHVISFEHVSKLFVTGVQETDSIEELEAILDRHIARMREERQLPAARQGGDAQKKGRHRRDRSGQRGGSRERERERERERDRCDGDDAAQDGPGAPLTPYRKHRRNSSNATLSPLALGSGDASEVAPSSREGSYLSLPDMREMAKSLRITRTTSGASAEVHTHTHTHTRTRTRTYTHTHTHCQHV